MSITECGEVQSILMMMLAVVFVLGLLLGYLTGTMDKDKT